MTSPLIPGGIAKFLKELRASGWRPSLEPGRTFIYRREQDCPVAAVYKYKTGRRGGPVEAVLGRLAYAVGLTPDENAIVTCAADGCGSLEPVEKEVRKRLLELA